MKTYPDLFSAPPMAAVPGRLAGAIAAGAPEHSAAELRPAARTSLWIFGVDYLIDHRAVTGDEVTGIVTRCFADGGDADGGDDDLTRFLAELRADLAAAPAFADLEPVWREERDRMLLAMSHEFRWKELLGLVRGAPRRPVPGFQVSLDDYLANSDNFGSTWVNTAHWIALGDPGELEHLAELRAASRVVQTALRLLNDLATRDREADWGDLNALTLGAEPAWVRSQIDELAARARAMVEPLRAPCPRAAAYLLRQFDYSDGFYSRGQDYWGQL
ncbi:hypothetical protein [Actinomadura terrae]|uniref:hypothetical protein n=1 Tax=Actinomadura terrae TaxID=604353 RepID=UPI001FA7944C|nr:hypothetical protein [Actinomadura terrae]